MSDVSLRLMHRRSEVPLRLVHSRPLLAWSEDFAATVLLSFAGLAAQCVFIAAGVFVLG
jgi:hypothetical protein